jgi:hypothetical protein
VAAAREEREVVVTVIDAYLRLIEADPQLYRFVVRGPAAAAEPGVVTDAVDTIAGGLSRVIGDRLRALGLDAGAAQPWAYGLVGFVGAVGDWWLRHAQPVGRAALTEYLTTLLWSGIDGVRASADLPGGLRAVGR